MAHRHILGNLVPCNDDTANTKTSYLDQIGDSAVTEALNEGLEYIVKARHQHRYLHTCTAIRDYSLGVKKERNK